jgi:hypothetical protein
MKLFIKILILLLAGSSLQAKESKFSIRAQIASKDSNLNGEYTVAIKNVAEQKFSFPIQNHYFYMTVVKSGKESFKIRLTAISDTDTSDAQTSVLSAELEPGIRNRLWLRGPKIKRLPLELTLQKK